MGDAERSCKKKKNKINFQQRMRIHAKKDRSEAGNMLKERGVSGRRKSKCL